MLRESKVELVKTEAGDWDGKVYVPTANDHTDRTPPTVTETTDELQDFLTGEIDKAVGTVNWAAGGMLLFLNTADGIYIPVGWRDADAPSYSECLCTASGIADDYGDVMNPRLIGYREALEEILLYNTAQEIWMLPQDSSIDIDEYAVTEELYDLWEQTDFVETDTEVTTVDATAHPIGSDTFTIYPPSDSEGPRNISGHFVLDNETRNVDIVDALVINIPEVSISDIRLFDGEEIGGDLLDREVYLFTPQEFKTLFDGQQSTALREFNSGQFTTQDGLTTAFKNGSEVTAKFDGVPTLTESHTELVRFLTELESFVRTDASD